MAYPSFLKSPRALFGLVLLTGLFAAVTVSPVPDLTVSGWFYDPGYNGFPMRVSPWAEWVRKQWPLYMFALIVLIFLLGLWGEITKRPRLGLTRVATVFLMLSLALGPGLLVNVVFKDHWGRPRPGSLAIYGGTADYFPPGVPGGPCAKNCSFPSGHASLAFWLAAPAALMGRRWRRPAVTTAVGFGLVIGFVRIAEGGHFLSDVLYAGLITLSITRILYLFLIAPSIPRVTKL